ncbi:MAG: hypothetical protein J6I76_00140 [Oribacterium sp.]|nr:hypothetical protein [Oribacterium sp.]
MLNKKMNELTVGESLKLSAIVTIVCFIPTVAVLGYNWYQENAEDVKEAIKMTFKKEED